jgi:cytochrome c oxidase cbb3-type subunit I/II
MWTAGIQQGLMWRAENDAGGLLYPNFVETLIAIRPMYWARLVGGLMYLLGFLIMAWNLIATARSGKAVDGETEVAVFDEPKAEVSALGLIFGQPVLSSIIVVGLLLAMALVGGLTSMVLAFVAFLWTIAALATSSRARASGQPTWHSFIETNGAAFTVLVVVAILVGGIAEITPTLFAVPETIATTKNTPYSALELEGRDVYLREGCYTCHSQMIRPFAWESARYGAVSNIDDSIFDHPFQWGSRRIGPDLARVGGKYANIWHFKHMVDPREISPGSNMPPYAHLRHELIDFGATEVKLRAMRNVGVPYSAKDIQNAEQSARADALRTAQDLASNGVKLCDGSGGDCDLDPESRMVALIAYLQRLGKLSNAPAGGDGEPVAAAAKSGGQP